MYTHTEGKGVSPSWQTSQKPLVWGLEYTCSTLKVTTELQELTTYVSYLWKLEDCSPVPRDLKIGTQFRDSDNEQRKFLDCAEHIHEMPVVIKIIAQLLFDSNLLINNYIFLGPHGC